jgi:hypothetical protein
MPLIMAAASRVATWRGSTGFRHMDPKTCCRTFWAKDQITGAFIAAGAMEELWG